MNRNDEYAQKGYVIFNAQGEKQANEDQFELLQVGDLVQIVLVTDLEEVEYLGKQGIVISYIQDDFLEIEFPGGIRWTFWREEIAKV